MKKWKDHQKKGKDGDLNLGEQQKHLSGQLKNAVSKAPAEAQEAWKAACEGPPGQKAADKQNAVKAWLMDKTWAGTFLEATPSVIRPRNIRYQTTDTPSS